MGIILAHLPQGDRRQPFFHPHNPTGRAWHQHELAALADFCQRHDLVVCCDCDEWHAALIGTLRANRDRVESVVAATPGLSMTHVEATYLAWIDARGLGVADPAAFFEAAGVGLSSDSDFGLPGWVRLNFGCPRTTQDCALEGMTSHRKSVDACKTR